MTAAIVLKWKLENTLVYKCFGPEVHEKIWMFYFEGKVKSAFRLLLLVASIVVFLLGFAEIVPKELTPAHTGSLMAEPYSWKSLVTGQPCLRIHTTAIRSSLLSLPPGRHVLKFMISSPIGYHIHIVSNTCFHFDDEEDIMTKITDV